MGETGTQDASVNAREEYSGTKTGVGDAVTVRLRNALDDAVEAKSSELVRHLAAAQLVHRVTGQVEF